MIEGVLRGGLWGDVKHKSGVREIFFKGREYFEHKNGLVAYWDAGRLKWLTAAEWELLRSGE